MSRFQLFSVCAVALILGGLSAIPVQAAQAKAKPARAEVAQPDLDWPQFLHGPQHSSRSLATAFTPSNAASAHQAWHWQPPVVTGKPAPVLDASPTVVDGRVFIGAQGGMFYALNEATGAVAWSRQLGIRPHVTCRPLGVTSTAAVLPDPVTGTSTVYVSGARYLYALDATTGTVSWQTEIGPPSTSNPDAYYNWSSPTVIDAHIYVGLASGCDDPLIRGGVVELDQHSGHVLRTWHSVPAGSIGGSVWSSVAANGHDVWVSTGNECDLTINTCPAGNKIGHSLSIVHLSATLKLLQSWQAPGTAGGGHDWDFGASPTLFGTSGMPAAVGACNKNGDFDALTANPLASSPLWTDVIAAHDGTTGSCFASADWDAPTGDLYLSDGATTIGTTSYGGSVDEANPATGAYIWRTGLPCTVVGTPTLDSAGVLAVGTVYRCHSTSDAYLIDAATGGILTTLPVGSTRVFGQPVFAQGALFVATETNGLYDFVP
jgi:outer membrane protein assembly factor BamB